MIVKRKNRKAEFFQMDNAPVQDPGLSWAAKGLLAYFLSLPEAWEVHLRDLFSRSPCSRVATESALNELIAAGYVVKEQGENKRRTTRYIVYEDPKQVTPEKAPFNKPTLTEITEYCQSRDNSIDPELFFNFYESNGWMRGGQQMQNWKMAVIAWEKRE
jgi:DNA-binding MarR family transcriptional regulator